MSDVVIVGAGPAGLATAIALRSHGLSACVLEREPRPHLRIGETVPGEIRHALHALGAWEAFAWAPHLPTAGNASAWGTSQLVRRDAFSTPLGAGWHLDRPLFEQLLDQRARNAGACVRRGCTVQGVSRTRQGGWCVHATTGDQPHLVRGRVLVDATGRRATLARWLGALPHVQDRLVCAYRIFGGINGIALDGWTLVEALRDGWWYAAPLPGGRAVAAIFTDSITCRARRLRDRAGWHRAWLGTTHLSATLTQTAALTHSGLAPVAVQCLETLVGEDWLAVGDAAAATDPLASAGITHALDDGIKAAAAIAARHGGARGAIAEHRESVRRRFAKHVVGRGAYYGLEDRWPDSRFWKDRRTLELDAVLGQAPDVSETPAESERPGPTETRIYGEPRCRHRLTGASSVLER